MDPNATLSKIYALMANVREPNVDVFSLDVTETAKELVDQLEALDSWLSNGGFLPEAWARR